MIRKKNMKLLSAMNEAQHNITSLHDSTGIAKSTLSMLVNNRSFPTMETAKKVCDELGILNPYKIFDKIYGDKVSK